MTIQDIVNMEKENKDSIVLLKEGIFWKAYEMSAYLFHTYIKPFKLLRKYVETIKGDVVSLGFPVAGTEKQLQGLNVLLHEDDKIILSKKRLLKILTLVYKANAALQKHTFIELAREEMVVVKLLLRVLCDLKQLSASAYAHAALLAESVSKQLVAWNKYCLQTNEQAG